MTVQAGLCQTWSETLKTSFLTSRFSCKAHCLYIYFFFQLKFGNDVIDYAVGDTSADNEQSSFDSLLLEERKDLDFTDHLWKVINIQQS